MTAAAHFLRAGGNTLHASRWEAIGWGASSLAFSNASNGDLVITRPSGTNGQLGIRYTPQAAITNVRVKARLSMSGWASLTDQQRVGPAARLTGTINSADWTGYYFRPQRLSTNDNIQFRLMRYIAGANNSTTNSTNFGGSSSWINTVWDMELSANGSSLYVSVLRNGDATTKVEQSITNTEITAAGSVGIFGFQIPVGFEVRVSAFSVEPISSTSSTPMAATEPAPGSFTVSSTTSPTSSPVSAAPGSFEVVNG